MLRSVGKVAQWRRRERGKRKCGVRTLATSCVALEASAQRLTPLSEAAKI